MVSGMRPPRVLAVVLVTSGLLLSGCAAEPAADPALTASASPTPAPTATAAGAAVPFDGDCDRVLTDAASAAIFALDPPAR